MQQYQTAADFAGSGLVPYLSAISTAIPPFWSVILFVFWIIITAVSYFAMLKSTGRKRFWNSFVASSFTIFLVSLPIAAMNGINNITFLEGYWVAFYLLWTVIGWYLLESHK